MAGQGRNPSSEGRKKAEIRCPSPLRGLFGFRASAFFRPSDFGLRISTLLLSRFAIGIRRAKAYNCAMNKPLCLLAGLLSLAPCFAGPDQDKPPVRFAIIGLTHDHANGFIPRARD